VARNRARIGWNGRTVGGMMKARSQPSRMITDAEQTSMDDYALVERAIHYLEDHFRDQPDLATLADHIGLSESHLQRVFQRWAGISPKRFVQVLSADYARARLEASANGLDAAYEVGLSGPGRLHDLTVNVYGMTPGEIKARGEGLTITTGVHSTPFGQALIAVTGRGVCGLHFLTGADDGPAREALRREWPGAAWRDDPAVTAPVARQIFAPGERQPLALLVRGTNFQVRVWEALLRVPPGALVTYGELAAAVGQPGASRAVGSAVGSNPIAYLIPCHRVIRRGGALGDYRWDPARKRAMIAWEAARLADQPGA